MQKIVFVVVSALILLSCGTKKAGHKEGTQHVHDDGTVHKAHQHEMLEQEAFEVHASKDSCDTAIKKTCDEHEHDDDHSH